REWIAAFAERLGMEPPAEGDFDTVLRLAAEAAHASERTAAPVACWLAGLAGRPLEEAIRLAEEVASR
ncbi:MAG: molybdenum cofactor guanylyltransferase, partial [Thermoleophilia bacterium]|nr:molybdenum cofactor guanylyltransferase [Thermoleophilia bacterium]